MTHGTQTSTIDLAMDSEASASISESYMWTPLDSKLIWIMVEEEKFCLPFRILTQGVEGLRGILLAAIQGEASNSMEDPCVMPTQIRACDWKAWVHYRGTFGAVVEDPPQGTLYWEGVLDIASLFIDDRGRQAAITHLSTGPSQSRNARKVFLGRKYHITEWIAPAFRSLITTNPHDLTANDIRDLDIGNHQTYLQITRIRQDIVRWQREKLLRAPSAVHDVSHCHGGRRARCEQAWVMHYRLSLIPLNHPTENIPAERVLTRMEASPGPEEMSIGCWTDSVATLRNATDFLTQCNGIIEQGVMSLLDI